MLPCAPPVAARSSAIGTRRGFPVLCAGFALASLLLARPAHAAESDERVGLVVTRAEGRRPSKRDVSKFEKALRKALQAEKIWRPVSAKKGKTLFQPDKARSGWRCRPDPIPQDEVADDGRVIHEDELFCATDILRDAGVGHLLLAHLSWSSGGYDVDIHHVRIDLQRVVARTSQRVRGKSFKRVLSFTPALAKRAMRELGGFRLETNVEGADVDMDGMFLGRTPLEQTDLAPGAYTLKITADGYFDWEGDAEVKPGEINVVTIELQQPRTSAPPPAFSASGDALKWGLVGLGAAAAVGGLVLAASSSDPTTRAAGIGLMAGGIGGAAYAFTYEF